jgi:hypothetical protein
VAVPFALDCRENDQIYLYKQINGLGFFLQNGAGGQEKDFYAALSVDCA